MALAGHCRILHLLTCCTAAACTALLPNGIQDPKLPCGIASMLVRYGALPGDCDAWFAQLRISCRVIGNNNYAA
mgnify:CR=1 FL=1